MMVTKPNAQDVVKTNSGSALIYGARRSRRFNMALHMDVEAG